MKKLIVLPLLLAAISLAAQSAKVELKTAKDSASYAFGLISGQRTKTQLGADYDVEKYLAGLRAMLLDDPAAAFNFSEATKVKQAYDQKIMRAASEKNLAEGAAFLAKNKLRAEVATTASGLQYEVLKRGEGKVAPTATDKVRAHYRGTLLSGEKFDASYDRGQPLEIGLNRVIRGWTEGMQLMHAGDKFKFYIPHDLAYGENPPPGTIIKPGATLIFEVELLDVLPAAPPPPPAPAPKTQSSGH